MVIHGKTRTTPQEQSGAFLSIRQQIIAMLLFLEKRTFLSVPFLILVLCLLVCLIATMILLLYVSLWLNKMKYTCLMTNDFKQIGYFSGILDPSKRPKKGKKGKKQCIKRAAKVTCAKMLSPPFPIVSLPIDKNLFSAENWDVKDLLNQTATDLCRIRETNAPTQSPTQPLNFESLDVYLYLDRSLSMQWHSDVCRSAPGANPNAPDNKVCWQLFVRFAESFVRNATQLRWPSAQSPQFGWQADRPLISQGVRVWLYGFACSGG